MASPGAGAGAVARVATVDAHVVPGCEEYTLDGDEPGGEEWELLLSGGKGDARRSVESGRGIEGSTVGVDAEGDCEPCRVSVE